MKAEERDSDQVDMLPLPRRRQRGEEFGAAEHFFVLWGLFISGLTWPISRRDDFLLVRLRIAVALRTFLYVRFIFLFFGRWSNVRVQMESTSLSLHEPLPETTTNNRPADPIHRCASSAQLPCAHQQAPISPLCCGRTNPNAGERGGRRGRRRYSDGGEPQRGMGATCMRYSPSGSHLAIGCKNGSLVVMAVETPNTAKGARTTDDGEDAPRHTATGESGRPLSGVGTAEGRERRVDLSNGVETRDDGALSPSSGRRPRERSRVHRRIAHLKGHSSRVLHLDWTVDGRFVHTCGQDNHTLHWEILPPPPHRLGEGATDEGALNDDAGDGDGGGEAVAGEFRPRMFKRAFLVRDEQWATWSSTIGWPVQVRRILFVPYLELTRCKLSIVYLTAGL